MRNWFRKKNNQDGAVTIEATIALTSFLFMFIMIYSIITVCRAQAKIQVAINSTAKELSQYSYVYAITGLHGSMSNLAANSEEAKADTNALAGDIADVFSGIQSIGGIEPDYGSVDGLMESWDEVSGDLEQIGESASSAKQRIEDMAKDPKKLLFGMAKLLATEGYELAKSAAAEAATRALTKKHLIRSESDTAEAFCRDVGIQPGTYIGKQSYFNGIDFSHSTLFPYGSEEITIVANYKMKLIQLLPIPFEFHFTQTAVTRGWMHGDGSAVAGTPAEKLEKMETVRGDSVWNAASGSEREKLIRSMGITSLKKDGYYGVSGQTYIHAYDPGTNTFAMIRSYNPLASVKSVEEVDKAAIRQYLEKLQGQMVSTTDNIQTIKLKKPDKDGNLKTSEVNCAGSNTKKIIVVIPQDAGLDTIFADVINEMGPSVSFEILPSYGTVFTTPPATTPTESGTEGGS